MRNSIWAEDTDRQTKKKEDACHWQGPMWSEEEGRWAAQATASVAAAAMTEAGTMAGRQTNGRE